MEPRDNTMGKDARISKSNGKGKDSVRLASKLSASASGLLQDALADLGANTLQTTLSSSGKPSFDSTPNSPFYWLQELPVHSTSATAFSRANCLPYGFRSTPSHHNGNLEFEQFVYSHGKSTPDLDFYELESTPFERQRSHDVDAKLRDVDMENLSGESWLRNIDSDAPPLHRFSLDTNAAMSSFLIRESPCGINSKGASLNEPLPQAHRGQNHFTSERVQADGLALTRLRMIFDHIVGSAQLLSPQHMPVRQTECNPDRDLVDEQSKPAFYCPWIRCHQRFNAMEVSGQAKDHAGFSCVHDDCAARLSTHQEWTEHIARPHHNLQEGSFPMTLVSSGGSIYAVTATVKGEKTCSGAGPHYSQ